MGRTALRVRPATDDDLPALVALGEQLRDVLVVATDPGVRLRTAAGRALLEQRYREALRSPDRRLVVVTGADDVPVGMAVFTLSSVNPLVDTAAVHMSHTVVGRGHERRGAGKALVAAAAAYAEERGIDQLVVSVNPGSREGNRFFARLGFAPMAVRRVAPVPVVRRRLAQRELSGISHAVRRRPRGVGAPAAPPATVPPAAAPIASGALPTSPPAAAVTGIRSAARDS